MKQKKPLPDQKFQPARPNHRLRRTQLWLANITGVLLTLVVASLLYLGNRWHSEADISASSRHSLSSQSIRTVSSFEQDVKITAVLGPNPVQREAVEKLVAQYRKYNEKLELEFVNPETHPARVRELDANPGGELIVSTGSADQYREKRLQSLSERSMTGALTQLSRGAERRVAFVTGHGERTTERQTNSDFSELAGRLTQVGLNASEISLVSQPSIPHDIDLLVIAAPTKRYFPGEVATLLNYISGGGNLLWLIDEEHDVGLKALSAELGIEPLPGVLLDATSSSYGADNPTFAIIDHTHLPDHIVNHTLGNPLLLPAASALNVTPLAGQSIQPLFFSSEQSWTESGPVAGAVRFDENSDEQRGPLLLAVALQRPLQHSTAALVEQPAQQRMAVIGDADWLASQWIGNGANLEYAERLFNWLAADEAQLAFATAMPEDALINPASRTILMMGGGFLFGLPLIFLAIATLLWRRQRNG